MVMPVRQEGVGEKIELEPDHFTPGGDYRVGGKQDDVTEERSKDFQSRTNHLPVSTVLKYRGAKVEVPFLPRRPLIGLEERTISSTSNRYMSLNDPPFS